ncbi:LytR C-terminal domain-containing protein [Nocardioides sp. KR10-350]|uniref:LytR C-terminal domain-containing protein n=1 Tax=Nocardioides cheoyonin TaxID=3156615 RepID=UPI0032B312B0
MGRRDQRGIALPSPVVLLSILAVGLAIVAFVLTGHDGPKEREITPAAAPETHPSASASAAPKVHKKPAKPKPKPIDRGKVYVEVYNNTNIRGLAGTVAEQAGTIGWNVVGADNWMGTVPATTVYYPPKLQAAGKKLALDLGIKRTHIAVQGSMKPDRLTIVLTGPLG